MIKRKKLIEQTCRLCERKFFATDRFPFCSKCHKARKERIREAHRKQKLRSAEAERLRAAVRDQYLQGNLPEHAKVHNLGAQVTVVLDGSSFTFHLAKNHKVRRPGRIRKAA